MKIQYLTDSLVNGCLQHVAAKADFLHFGSDEVSLYFGSTSAQSIITSEAAPRRLLMSYAYCKSLWEVKKRLLNKDFIGYIFL